MFRVKLSGLQLLFDLQKCVSKILSLCRYVLSNVVYYASSPYALIQNTAFQVIFIKTEILFAVHCTLITHINELSSLKLTRPHCVSLKHAWYFQYRSTLDIMPNIQRNLQPPFFTRKGSIRRIDVIGTRFPSRLSPLNFGRVQHRPCTVYVCVGLVCTEGYAFQKGRWFMGCLVV